MPQAARWRRYCADGHARHRRGAQQRLAGETVFSACLAAPGWHRRRPAPGTLPSRPWAGGHQDTVPTAPLTAICELNSWSMLCRLTSPRDSPAAGDHAVPAPAPAGSGRSEGFDQVATPYPSACALRTRIRLTGGGDQHRPARQGRHGAATSAIPPDRCGCADRHPAAPGPPPPAGASTSSAAATSSHWATRRMPSRPSRYSTLRRMTTGAASTPSAYVRRAPQAPRSCGRTAAVQRREMRSGRRSGQPLAGQGQLDEVRRPGRVEVPVSRARASLDPLYQRQPQPGEHLHDALLTRRRAGSPAPPGMPGARLTCSSERALMPPPRIEQHLEAQSDGGGVCGIVHFLQRFEGIVEGDRHDADQIMAQAALQHRQHGLRQLARELGSDSAAPGISLCSGCA